MKIALAFKNPAILRTIYFQTFLDYVISNPRFVTNVADPGDTVIFPHEDFAPYLNWPRYHLKGDVFARGSWNQPNMEADWNDYIARFLALPGLKCVLNSQKQYRLSQETYKRTDVFVADINLRQTDRWLNPRTISMPALPLHVGVPGGHERKLLASFKGARTHPCREALLTLHNGTEVHCELVAAEPYQESVDATGLQDMIYTELLANSVFAFIPRGDALFSYRLLEAMSFGCIPVIFADDWVLPFDRSIRWSDVSLHVSEASIPKIPKMLRAVPKPTIRFMQKKVAATYQRFFSSPQVIFENMFRELEDLLPFCDPPEAEAAP